MFMFRYFCVECRYILFIEIYKLTKAKLQYLNRF